jgi:hypothetical protein
VSIIDYIPLATALFSLFFFIELFQHWMAKPGSLHIMWWAIGIFFYGAGTINETIHAIAGYSPLNFKIWYICGPLLAGAPLAQGTVYLLMKRKTANILSGIVVAVMVIIGILIILSPLKPVTDVHTKLSGSLLEWSFIRYTIIFPNVYALVFLVGGAIYSARLYAKNTIDKSRFWGNVLIALGTLLPGIGGSAATQGHIELLYITEFIGIGLIHAGYEIIRYSFVPSVYSQQR